MISEPVNRPQEVHGYASRLPHASTLQHHPGFYPLRHNREDLVNMPRNFFLFFQSRSGTCAWLSLLYFRLFEYTVHRSRREVIGQMSGDGNPAGLFGMFILTMTPFGCYEIPSIVFDYFYHFPNFQDDTSKSFLSPLDVFTH